MTARSTAFRSASGRRGHMPTRPPGCAAFWKPTCGRSRWSPSRCCPAPASNASSLPRRPAFAGTPCNHDLQLQPKGLSPMNDIHAAETKALGRFDLPHAFDDFMRAFEAFKEANDERLGEIEKRMSADAVTAERVERIGAALDQHKKALDQLSLKRLRPPL